MTDQPRQHQPSRSVVDAEGPSVEAMHAADLILHANAQALFYGDPEPTNRRVARQSDAYTTTLRRELDEARGQLLGHLSDIAEMLGRPPCRNVEHGPVSIGEQTRYVVEAVETLSRAHRELQEQHASTQGEIEKLRRLDGEAARLLSENEGIHNMHGHRWAVCHWLQGVEQGDTPPDEALEHADALVRTMRIAHRLKRFPTQAERQAARDAASTHPTEGGA